ncbi:MAG: TetR/AcrR family transcriptional regulator C-terminal domain-containing protein [Chloroflexota bacterium]
MAGQESGEEGASSAAYSPFTSLPASAYPSIAALAALLAEPDGDGRFQFGLKVILDGLERQLRHQASARYDRTETG